jgi:hypothetical protein
MALPHRLWHGMGQQAAVRDRFLSGAQSPPHLLERRRVAVTQAKPLGERYGVPGRQS